VKLGSCDDGHGHGHSDDDEEEEEEEEKVEEDACNGKDLPVSEDEAKRETEEPLPSPQKLQRMVDSSRMVTRSSRDSREGEPRMTTPRKGQDKEVPQKKSKTTPGLIPEVKIKREPSEEGQEEKGPKRPSWMSLENWTRIKNTPHFDRLIRCKGCSQTFPCNESRRHPSLEFYIHCVEQCDKYPKSSIETCRDCNFKFLKSFYSLDIHRKLRHPPI
jgi:hypothetical protein